MSQVIKFKPRLGIQERSLASVPWRPSLCSFCHVKLAHMRRLWHANAWILAQDHCRVRSAPAETYQRTSQHMINQKAAFELAMILIYRFISDTLFSTWQVYPESFQDTTFFRSQVYSESFINVVLSLSHHASHEQLAPTRSLCSHKATERDNWLRRGYQWSENGQDFCLHCRVQTMNEYSCCNRWFWGSYPTQNFLFGVESILRGFKSWQWEPVNNASKQ